MSILDLFREKEEIRPELIVAYNTRIPESINVKLSSSEDGGYIAEIENIDNCVTQADSGRELIEMVNDAMHTSLDIPETYRKYVVHYQPPQEIIDTFGMKVPNEYLNKRFVMKRIVA